MCSPSLWARGLRGCALRLKLGPTDAGPLRALAVQAPLFRMSGAVSSSSRHPNRGSQTLRELGPPTHHPHVTNLEGPFGVLGQHTEELGGLSLLGTRPPVRPCPRRQFSEACRCRSACSNTRRRSGSQRLAPGRSRRQTRTAPRPESSRDGSRAGS